MRNPAGIFSAEASVLGCPEFSAAQGLSERGSLPQSAEAPVPGCPELDFTIIT
ncbi:hypothetical protein KKH18_02545 [bacterium]|nr:hypothetical protein [bacterium]